MLADSESGRSETCTSPCSVDHASLSDFCKPNKSRPSHRSILHIIRVRVFDLLDTKHCFYSEWLCTKAQEIGWNRYVPNRAVSTRRVASYIEDDMIGCGDILEIPCQRPPDIRCTIAVASSSDGECSKFLHCANRTIYTVLGKSRTLPFGSLQFHPSL